MYEFTEYRSRNANLGGRRIGGVTHRLNRRLLPASPSQERERKRADRQPQCPHQSVVGDEHHFLSGPGHRWHRLRHSFLPYLFPCPTGDLPPYANPSHLTPSRVLVLFAN